MSTENKLNNPKWREWRAKMAAQARWDKRYHIPKGVKQSYKDFSAKWPNIRVSKEARDALNDNVERGDRAKYASMAILAQIARDNPPE